MPRTKTGVKRRRRHNRIRKAAKGFRGQRGHTLKGAKEGLMHALQHAYRDRRTKKRDLRSLWIIRLNGALKEHGISYSNFISKLKSRNIQLNRKILSRIALHDPETFSKIVSEVQKTQA